MPSKDQFAKAAALAVIHKGDSRSQFYDGYAVECAWQDAIAAGVTVEDIKAVVQEIRANERRSKTN